MALHTDCGMMNATDDDVRARIKRKWPEKAGKIEWTWFGAFTKGLRENVRGEMALVRRIRTWGRGRGGLEVLGCVFDIETGTAEEMVMD